MPSREEREYELNEVSWWAKWVDETVWVSKNCYAIFSEAFKHESFYNRGGFLGVERVPEDAVEAIEKEFEKRKRSTPCILVEEGRPWDRLRKSLSAKGYAVGDKMLVMESHVKAKSKSPPNPEVEVTLVAPRSKGKELQEWTRTYLQAFYGDQRLSGDVNRIMRKVVKDKKASVILAKMGRTAVGCAVMNRSAGGMAGAYCIGTVPGFRGKGVAAAMMKYIREVAQGEARRLILQTMASDSVEGFYLKQGFRLAYTKALYERRPRKTLSEEAIPSGETFGVTINRGVAAGTTRPFVEVFSGFEAVDVVRRLFGPDTDEVISKLKIHLNSPRGYLRVDGETGNVIINPDYLKTGHERHLYLDVIHELAHVKQFREGKELYDRRFAYFERPTEIEAYEVAVEEARRIGMDKEEIVDYLRVEWVTEEEFMRFVSLMRIHDG
ncbi:MAG TPA: GNAT family N-acetyltransferase [Nitrososphaerales archaeon]|nr:GNAT family N-acetyltransferase [Nitrososphaerales archaeon]